MTAPQGRSALEKLARRWRRRQAVALVLRVAGLSVPLLVVAKQLDVPLAWAAAAAALGAWLLPRPPFATALRMARHLDRVAPELEESATLLLENDADLAPLQRLQRDRALEGLASLPPHRVLSPGIWTGGAREAGVGLLVALLFLALVGRAGSASIPDPTTGGPRPDGTLPGDVLSDVVVRIHPPEYAERSPVEQQALDVEALAGSTVAWRLPAVPGVSVRLVTGTGDSLPFTGAGDSQELTLLLETPLVYRLIADRAGADIERSTFARLEVIPDTAPDLVVIDPVQRLTILEGDIGMLDVEVRAEDDHRLQDAALVVTLALGAGEQVEFRERRIPLPIPPGVSATTLRAQLDLPQLGVGPAAELYFHIEARDNRRPVANLGRSATSIVRVAGEAIASTDLGAGLPIILPPTYFRSQRQIIIDTEKLIADEASLEASEFRSRSESLGRDQRALRMRYGALLGEEFVSGQAAGEEDLDEPLEEAEHDSDGSGPESILEILGEGMVHAHDSAEIATYFTSETRTRLKKVLAEMWDAEGRLRVVDPTGALPYEYRALKLLKELQEASRIYVQKVGFEAPPLEPEERRLTGDLEEVSTTFHERPAPASPEVEAAARALLTYLASPRTSDPAGVTAVDGLRATLARRAATDPQALDALGALDSLASGRQPTAEEMRQLAAVLWSLLPSPDHRPVRPVGASDPLTLAYEEQSQEEGLP